MLLKRLNKKPDFIAIAWDAQQKTFRHELAPDYKATRKKMDDDCEKNSFFCLTLHVRIPFLQISFPS